MCLLSCFAIDLQLTDEEKRRREMRKIKNREAANRSRARKKTQKEHILQEMRILQERNKELQATVQTLEYEISSMKKLFEIPSNKDIKTSWDTLSNSTWDNYPCSPLHSSTNSSGSRPCSPEDGIVPGSQSLTNLYNNPGFLIPCSPDEPIPGPSSCESGFAPSPSPTLDDEKNIPWWLQNIQKQL
ncbi:hypothetical protein CHS0354_037544 [Potamilus streckersoni]|uniref:BZIP domain-containing protein n=1 Tax=Potamilus streckersoni TaxID=2493646 RepID=A0AAE0TB79_9BIVA|nr:hypothetical protein CHS0354_037544 [Potamilus streckersoni]